MPCLVVHAPGRQGPTHAVERFSDYRAVDGAQLAHATGVSHDGERVVELQLLSVQLDAEVDEAIFLRPG